MSMKIIAVILFSFFSVSTFAQDKEMETVKDDRRNDESSSEHGFKKENLFIGGGIQLSLSNHNFGVGANPVMGYSINKWVDVGIGVNWNYISQREAYLDAFGNEYTTGNKIHQ